MEIKKPKQCAWISNKNWDSLSMKEKDFVIFTHERKYTRKQIMRKLYFSDKCSFWRIQTKVRDKLKDDIAKCNENIKKAIQSS